MTTIIIDGDSKRVYTDSRGTITEAKLQVSIFPPKVGVSRSSRYRNDIRKVFSGEHFLVVGTGNYADLIMLKNALLDGGKMPRRFSSDMSNVYKVSRKDDFNVAITKYSNQVKKLFGLPYWKKLVVTETTLADSHLYVDGSGMRYAQGAIGGGATPADAIRIAAKLDEYTDDGIVSMPIPGYIQKGVV